MCSSPSRPKGRTSIGRSFLNTKWHLLPCPLNCPVWIKESFSRLNSSQDETRTPRSTSMVARPAAIPYRATSITGATSAGPALPSPTASPTRATTPLTTAMVERMALAFRTTAPRWASGRTATALMARLTRVATCGNGMKRGVSVQRVGCGAGRSTTTTRTTCFRPTEATTTTRRVRPPMSVSAWQVFLSPVASPCWYADWLPV